MSRRWEVLKLRVLAAVLAVMAVLNFASMGVFVVWALS